MKKRGLLLIGVTALLACRNSSHQRPALFGLSDQVVEQLRKTCRGDLKTLELTADCHGRESSYSIGHEANGRVDNIGMFQMTDDQLRETFDRVFAPMVSDEVRELMRSSIINFADQNYFDAIFTSKESQIVMRVTLEKGGKRDLIWVLTDR